MKRGFIILGIILIGLLGCDKLGLVSPKKEPPKSEAKPVPQVKGTIIAKVNNMFITLEELERYITIYNSSIDAREDLSVEQKKALKYETRDRKLEYLKEILVRQRVFYQAAVDRGLDRREDIQDILEKNKIAILAQAMEGEALKNIDVTAAEIQSAYDESKQVLREPETRRIREIVVKTEDEAKQIMIELYQGGDFVSLARTRSIGASAKEGGDLGSIQPGERGAQFVDFDNVAFSPALQKGALSSIFKGSDGYYIIKIEEIKQGRQYALDDTLPGLGNIRVRDLLRERLLAAKQDQELDKVFSQLKGDMKIETYEGEIK